MKKHLIVMMACLLSGCAIAPEDGPYDYCQFGTEYQNCGATRDAGDWIDSKGCNNPVTVDDVYKGRISQSESFLNQNLAENSGSMGNSGYVGEIDSDCHMQGEIDGHTVYGSDVDFIKIEVEPDTPLEVRVERAFNSAMSPVAYLYDDAGHALLPTHEVDGVAYLRFLAPTNPLFVSVEEWKNYRHNHTSGCDKSLKDLLKGGQDYRYVVRVAVPDEYKPLENISLLPTGNPGSKLYELSKPFHLTYSGDVHYVEFSYLYQKKEDFLESCGFDVYLNVSNAKNGSKLTMSLIKKQTDPSGKPRYDWDMRDIKNTSGAYAISAFDGWTEDKIWIEDEEKPEKYTYRFAIFDSEWSYDYDVSYSIYLRKCN
ncbi:MAG: hypothetical protein IKY83_10675 [Proteobacteria bacterium]|nr:hypothetical protein [Pseudomonadota bacterium]